MAEVASTVSNIVAGSGFVNGLFQLLTIKTISIGSIQHTLAITVQVIYRQARHQNSPRQNDKCKGTYRDTRHSLNTMYT